MKEFDYRGLKCPIPVLKAFREIKKNPRQKNFKFICDDKTAPKDFKDLCNNTGLKLSRIIKKESYFLILLDRL